MNSKIKKIMLLTTGLAGGLLATSIAGITLSSCTFQVQQDPNNNNNNNNQGNSGSTNQGTTTSPKDELTYNPNANYYTTQIIFDKDGNITNASANTLTIKDGLIFADPAMTTLIGIMPSMQQSTVTIPATVKAITGYQAAVVYDTGTGKIVNPTFSKTTGITLTGTQALLDLGSVGAFQKLGKITDGNNGTTRTVTPPSLTGTTNGLNFVTSIQFENGSQLQSIGPKAFAGCNNLTTVNLPNSTNTIGALAFQNCTNLQTINLKGVSYIGDAAFNNAFIAQNDALAQANKVSLDLTSAQFIGVGAFDSSVWTSTTTTTTTGGSQSTTTPPVQVLPGTMGSTSTDSGSSTTTTVTVTETPNLSKISTVSFAKPLTTLSPYAFNGANYLTAADLSNCTSLASVGNNAFSNTQNLTSVKFSNTIDTIGNNAFSGAPLKETLTFNTDTDLTIGDNAFNSQALTTIDFSQVKGNIAIGNSAFSNSNTTNTSLKTLTLPAVPTTGNIKNIVMIDENAFNNCTNLNLPGFTGNDAATYSLPANIGYVGQNAFSAATLATIEKGYAYTPNFDITNEWTNVANGLFAGVTNGSTYFGPLKANNNTNLTSVDLSNTNIQALNYGDLKQTVTNSHTNNSVSIQSGTFANASQLTDITLPASCNQFGLNYSYYSGAFARCTSLQNLNFKNFEITPVGGAGDNAVTAGFSQINQQTWVQVANIMNALAYFGQQNIVANSDVESITSQEQMNAITYNINADPVAETGTWAKWVGANNEGSPVSGNPPMILRGMAEWASQRSNFNYPINAYPAGSYGYTVTPAASGGVGARDGETPVTVKYPAGLGTSVSANFKEPNANNPSLSVQMSNGGSTLGFGSNGPLLNGSGSNADSSVVFNTNVANASSIIKDSTITLSNNSTRPQSVWYTVSASGTVGTDPANGTQATQVPYTPTTDENNNIFAITSGKIPAASNGGTGGVGSNSQGNIAPYTTVVGGTASGGNDSSFGIAVAVPTTSLVTDNANNNNNITLSQNYLPLGITANVKDAYFNHNGIIWHYHNGFAANDPNPEISITGQVNAYIGGTIQAQNSGAKYLSIEGWTTSGSNSKNRFSNTLANGVYDNGNGLTSVGSLSGKETYTPQQDVYGIDNEDLSSSGQNTVCYPYVSLFGGKTGTGYYSQSVGPANVQVKLTLVPGTETVNK